MLELGPKWVTTVNLEGNQKYSKELYTEKEKYRNIQDSPIVSKNWTYKSNLNILFPGWS